MFGLFGNGQKNKTAVVDKVWMSTKAKFDACVQMAKASQQCIFVAWFPETQSALKNLFKTHSLDSVVVLAPELKEVKPENILVFIEHHPLVNREQNLFAQLGLQEVPILSSLEEPFFQLFGGERLIRLTSALGLAENEIVGHPMITSSIQKAQTKISKQVKFEKEASSQEAWFTNNNITLGR